MRIHFCPEGSRKRMGMKNERILRKGVIERKEVKRKLRRNESEKVGRSINGGESQEVKSGQGVARCKIHHGWFFEAKKLRGEDDYFY